MIDEARITVQSAPIRPKGPAQNQQSHLSAQGGKCDDVAHARRQWSSCCHPAQPCRQSNAATAPICRPIRPPRHPDPPAQAPPARLAARAATRATAGARARRRDRRRTGRPAARHHRPRTGAVQVVARVARGDHRRFRGAPGIGPARAALVVIEIARHAEGESAREEADRFARRGRGLSAAEDRRVRTKCSPRSTSTRATA